MSTIRKIRYRGDCMEGRGLPPSGTAVYDEQLQPRVLDLVVCEHPLGAINLYLKEVVRTGAKPIVRTCYADGKKNFATLSPKIIGVVIEARDEEGRVVYRRPRLTRADDLRGLHDEALAAYLEKELGDSVPTDWLAWLHEGGETQ